MTTVVESAKLDDCFDFSVVTTVTCVDVSLYRLFATGIRFSAAFDHAGEEAQQHSLTHESYRDWCEICVKHRARQDAHPKSTHENAGH